MWSAQAACAMQEQQTCQRSLADSHGSNHDIYNKLQTKKTAWFAAKEAFNPEELSCSSRVLRHARFAWPAGVLDLVRATKNEVRAKEQTVTARVNSSEPRERRNASSGEIDCVENE